MRKEFPRNSSAASNQIKEKARGGKRRNFSHDGAMMDIMEKNEPN
jgi:hypothetical protein